MSVCVQSIATRWFGGRFGFVLLFVFGAVSAGIAMGHFASRTESSSQVAAVTKTAVLQDSTWLSEGYWRRKRLKKLQSNQFSGRSNLGFNPFTSNFARPKPKPKAYSNGNYRTVCVRLCDGYYFPVSFSTTRDRFAQDDQACRSKCSSDARLFFYRNSGGSPETMTDLNGRAYAKLKTAFLYRTSFNKSCQCRPDPWSDAAKQRHAMYATKDWQRKASRLAKQKRRTAKYARANQRSVAPHAITVHYSTKPPLVFGQLTPRQARTAASRRTKIRRQRRKQARYQRARPKSSKSWKRAIFNN